MVFTYSQTARPSFMFRRMNVLLPNSIRFASMCPTCKDLRDQEALLRTAVGRLALDQPIEAWCVVCDLVWEISESERRKLARLLLG